jgi:hypothetical protein
MIVTLNLQTRKIKARGHTTDAIIRFEYHGAMAITRQLIRYSQTHGASTQNRYVL